VPISAFANGRIIRSSNAASYCSRFTIYYYWEREDRGFADGNETREGENLFRYLARIVPRLLGHGLNPGTAENVRNEKKKKKKKKEKQEKQATKIRATR